MLSQNTGSKALAFSSVSRSSSHQNNVTADQDADEFRISECSSNSSDGAKDQENQWSFLQISDYSNDENEPTSSNNFVEKTYFRTLQNGLRVTPGCKRRRPLRLRKTNLPKLKIETQSKKSRMARESSAVLALENDTDTNPKPCTEETSKVSPWDKVRRDFRRLRQVNRCSVLSSSAEAIRHFHHDDSEDAIERASSPSTSADESQKCSQEINTPSTSSQASNPPTELDLFVALIERECYAAGKLSTKNRQTKRRRCRRGGYLHRLQRTLAAAKTDRKFLEHDKKFGLHSGVKLTVRKLDVSFGVYMATVQVDNAEGVLQVILDAQLAKNLKAGSQLEAFFSNGIEPYRIKWQQGVAVPTYVQPYRLLLIKS